VTKLSYSLGFLLKSPFKRNVVAFGLDAKNVRLPYTLANYPTTFDSNLLICDGDSKEVIIDKLTRREKRKQNKANIEQTVTALWDIQEKLTEIKIVWSDPAFWPTGQSQKVVWYCQYHDCVSPKNPASKMVIDGFGNSYSHITPDGQPAYFTFVKHFINTKTGSNAVCCLVADELRKKALGYELALTLLEQRGKVYGTLFTMPDINSATQWAGKRQGRQGTKVRIHCSLHNVIEKRRFETLLRHCACPCSVCRKNNMGSGKINNFPKIVDRLEKYAGPDRQFFRIDALSLWGATCYITGLKFKPNKLGNYSTRLEAHHINQQSVYTKAKKETKYNSVMLLACIHQGYHNIFLSNSWNSNYDSASINLNWVREANTITFLEFLLQLKRDLVLLKEALASGSARPQNTLHSILQRQVGASFQLAKKGGWTDNTSAAITVENLDKAINTFSQKPYIGFFLSQPSSKLFIESYDGNFHHLLC
jgi:hypothetical protein